MISNVNFTYIDIGVLIVFRPGSVAQSDVGTTGDQEVASSQIRSGPILWLRLIMKSFLRKNVH